MVLKSRPLFSLAWQARYAKVVERAMPATITIYKVVGEPTYNSTTDTWTPTITTWYTGKARVQPISSAFRADVPGNDTSVQKTLFSIPIASIALALRPALLVSVTASPLNTSLLAYQFVIDEVLDSANPIEKTFICTSDTEKVA